MPPDPLVDVSRETHARLTRLCDLVRRWNPRINLVSPRTLDDIWQRHVIDSAQVVPLVPEEGRWIDLGSGGGFPAAVACILTGRPIECVESDARKAAFLRTVARELQLPLAVATERIEEAAPRRAAVVTARALAPLPRLLELVARHMGETGVAVLMKGERWREELEAARQTWHLSCEAKSSITNPDAAILRIGVLRRA